MVGWDLLVILSATSASLEQAWLQPGHPGAALFFCMIRSIVIQSQQLLMSPAGVSGLCVLWGASWVSSI